MQPTTIAVGLTLYQEEFNDIRSLEFFNDFDYVYVYCNSEINDDISAHKNVILLGNDGCNVGLSRALNRIIDTCKADNLLLIDQDTLLNKSFIDTIKKLGAAENTLYAPRMIEPIGYTQSAKWVLTAGMYSKLEVFKKVRFNHDVFLDFSDIEFCMACLNDGVSLCHINTYITHNLGNTITNSIFGKKFYVTNHMPFRYLLMNRSLIALMKSNRIRLADKWQMVRHYALIFFQVLMFEESLKWDKLKRLLGYE